MVEKLVESAAPRIMGVGAPLVVVGIPAYNEERTIGRVVLQARKFSGLVVVCDDGSSDMTAEISEGLGAIVVRHETNLGYGAAIQSLFRQARKLNAEVLVTVDGDGQHDPREVPDVAQPVLNGSADVVIGSRFVSRHGTQSMPFYRRAGVKLITKLVNGSAKNGVSDAQSGFRAYGRRALDLLSVAEDGMGISVEILFDANKHGLKVCEVSSSCKYENGKGVKKATQNPIKQLASVLMSIIRYAVEDRPLTMLGVPGAFCLLTGVLFGIWMLQIYAAEHLIVTNIALASVAFVIIGLFALFTSIVLYAICRLAETRTAA
ncbi:MAG: glycosyltransferase family 2 protein [Candidatus Bathyarchaeota archaeon]|nr:glycosyltransferase family 2 protein [Candidatus Bathyarchaeota archaeon]